MFNPGRTIHAPSRADIEALLARHPVRRVVVLGANGTMGYQGGALFAGAGAHVTFLARSREKAGHGRTAAAEAVRSTAITSAIDIGSYDEDLPAAVAQADLIFEAVAEQHELKREMFELVDRWRRDDAIVVTVSSGLSITELAAGRSASFQRCFLGLHLFNPPSMMLGTEIVAGEQTSSTTVDAVEAYAAKRLGRITVRVADRPGFAGNRIGFKVLNEAAQLAETHGVLLIDKLIGPYTGRALSPLATIDLVGWDVHRAIVENVATQVQDEASATYLLPETMRRLIARGTLGSKSGAGFYKRGERRDKQELLVLDLETETYRHLREIALPPLPFVEEIAELHRYGQYRRGLQRFASAEGEHAQLAQQVIAGYIAYAYARVGEVADDIGAIDRIMAAGFNWAPPSTLVEGLGLDTTVRMIERAGLPVPPSLLDATEPTARDPQISPGRYFVAR